MFIDVVALDLSAVNVVINHLHSIVFADPPAFIVALSRVVVYCFFGLLKLLRFS